MDTEGAEIDIFRDRADLADASLFTGPERGNRKGVTRKAAEKLPKKVNLGGPWHGNVPLSVVTQWLPLSRYPFRGQ